MRIVRVIIAGALTAAAAPYVGVAAAQDELAAIRALMTDAPRVCRAFAQEKKMRALSRPLVSSGTITFVAGKGIVWRVTRPIAITSVLAITDERIVTLNNDGTAKVTAIDQLPLARVMAQVFLSAFSGDMAGLRESFDIDPSVAGETWHMILTPRDRNIAAAIAKIEVSGGRFVEELAISENGGDRTRLSFTGMSTDPCELSDAEMRHL